MIPELTDLDIRDGDVVAVDLETHDPDLKTHGSGAIVGKGKVCGIAVAYRDEKYYFPIAHLYSGQNLGKNTTWKVLNRKIKHVKYNFEDSGSSIIFLKKNDQYF